MRKLYSRSRELLRFSYKLWMLVDLCIWVSWGQLAYFMQSWGYPISALDSFLLVLFEKYAELLKKRFSDDFQEVRKLPGCFERPSLLIDFLDCVDR